MAVMAIRNLVKTYAVGDGEVRALAGVSLDVDAGEFLAVLNRTRGITVLLITHEMDIAEHATRIISFRDGRIQADRAVSHRRLAADEISHLTLAVA